MRAVLIGADLMYRQDGKIVPIEINTNTAWDANNRLEEFNDCFDYDSFKAFLDLHNIEEIWVDGLMAGYLVKYFGDEKGLDIVIKSEKELEEAEDRDGLLLLRTSYSDEALVDAFCRDKDLFLEAIKSFDFGCEFILKTEEGFTGEITEIVDNGDYPNFVVKYRYPYYDRGIYPKLVKLANQEELTNFINSEEFQENYLIMPFYYNEHELYETDVETRMKFLRHLSMFALVDESLEAVPVGTYTKLCGNLKNIHCKYSELGVLDSESRKAFLNYWAEPAPGDVLAERGDLVLMADDTWKPVEELAVGDMIKSLDIPTKDGANVKNHVEDYNISFEELQESSSYSNNAVVRVAPTTGVATKVNVKFTDGTDWWDTADSSYPTIDPEDGTVWFRTLEMLDAGDKIILLDANDPENPEYVEKEIEEIERTRAVIDGYQLVVEGSHLFITKYSSEAGAYVSIEHNADAYCQIPASTTMCAICTAGVRCAEDWKSNHLGGGNYYTTSLMMMYTAPNQSYQIQIYDYKKTYGYQWTVNFTTVPQQLIWFGHLQYSSDTASYGNVEGRIGVSIRPADITAINYPMFNIKWQSGSCNTAACITYTYSDSTQSFSNPWTCASSTGTNQRLRAPYEYVSSTVAKTGWWPAEIALHGYATSSRYCYSTYYYKNGSISY